MTHKLAWQQGNIPLPMTLGDRHHSTTTWSDVTLKSTSPGT